MEYATFEDNGNGYKEIGELPTVFTKENIIETVERELPGFADACKAPTLEGIIMCQAAFATDLQRSEVIPPKEMTLFAMAMKYAGFMGKEVKIINALQ